MLIKHQPWHLPEDSNSALFEFEWNMWSTKMKPFNDLEQDDTILTCTGGGPANGRLLNASRVDELVKGRYESLPEAWALIETGITKRTRDRFGLTRASFLRHPYTARAPQQGWLMAWASSPELIIDAPRPDSLRFRPNGWAELPDRGVDRLLRRAKAVQDADMETVRCG